MTVERMDHVGIVVDDLAAATEFFLELGLEPQGKGTAGGDWVDGIVGLEGVQVEFAMMETPDGHGKLELVKFHSPSGPEGGLAGAGEHPWHPSSRFRGRRHRRRPRWLARPWRGARWRGGTLWKRLSALLRPRP